MYNVSQYFKDMMRSINREIGLKIVVNGVEYTNASIVELDIENLLSSGGNFKLGEVISSRLNFTLREFGLDIPENALVEPYLRFEGGLVWNEADYKWSEADFQWSFSNTEWIPMGKFYIDNRVFSEQRLWRFECYDRTMFLHQDYITNLAYPQTMRNVLQEVCYQANIEIENIEAIDPTYLIYIMPTNLKLHQVVSYIASANRCSAIMNRDGKLKFIKFTLSMYNNPVETLTMRDYFKATRMNDIKVFDTIKLYEKDNFTEGEFTELVRGSGGEYTTLSLVNPFMNESMLDDLYNEFVRFEYTPYELDYKCFPHLELGDVITIEQSKGSSWLETSETWGNADFTWNYDIVGFNVIVLYDKITYRGGLRSTLKAEAESAQTSEFKVKGTLREYIERVDKAAVKEAVPYNGVTTSREYGVQVERSDGKAKAIMNATEGYSLWSDTGTGLERKFFVDLNGRIQARGLDIAGDATFEGTIEASDIIGGTINIGNGNFTVDSNGHMIAESGEFEGTITGSDIIGGTIDIGSGNFTVDSSGNMIAYSGQFKGDITGATGNFQGTVKANQILIGGSNGRLSFEDLNDQPFIPDDGYITTITEDTIMTTNIYARYLEIQAANIRGTLTADQIDTNIAQVNKYLTLGDGYESNSRIVFNQHASIRYDNTDMSINTEGKIELFCIGGIIMNSYTIFNFGAAFYGGTTFEGTVDFSNATVIGL